MPYFARLIQHTGMTFSHAHHLESASGYTAPQPESVPALEVEEVRDIDATDQAHPLDEADHPAPPPVLQPTPTDVSQPVPQGPRAGTEPKGTLHQLAAAPLAVATPAPVPQALATSQEQLAQPPSRNAETPVIEMTEIVESVPDALASGSARASRPIAGHKAEYTHVTPEPTAHQAATSPASAPLPPTLLPSLAEVLTWVAGTPAGGDQEPPPGRHPTMAEGEEAAPWRHAPILTRPAPELPPAAEPSQHFSLHIGTIQLTIEAPQQPSVDPTPAPAPPVRPQPAPAPASQASRWRRHYMRL